MLDLLISAFNWLNSSFEGNRMLSAVSVLDSILASIYIVLIGALFVILTVFMLKRNKEYIPQRIADLYNNLSEKKSRVAVFNIWFFIIWFSLAINISFLTSNTSGKYGSIVVLIFSMTNVFLNLLKPYSSWLMNAY